MAEFAPPEEFVGMSLADLRRKRSEPFRADLLAGMLGIGEQTAFKEGQLFNIANPDPGSAEFQFLQSAFRPGTEVREEQRLAEEERRMQQAREAVQPAIETLQSGIEPLKQRYSELIDSIKGTQKEQLQKAQTVASRELGRRGVPLSSSIAQELIQERELPVQSEFGRLLAQTGLGAQQAEQDILSRISQLQSGAGMSGFEAAVNAAQFLRQLQQRESEFETETGLARERLDIQRQGLEGQEPDPFDRFVRLGEGQTLFDLGTLQKIFTAPKKFKGSGGGGGGDPLGLF